MKIFISHASEDKMDVARPLADNLRDFGYDVWYDEYSLRLGDSLREEIDRGLAECDYGLVVISRAFLSKKWPKQELAGLVARETGSREEGNIILPIWHGVTEEEVRSYSPTLADRVAVSTMSGLTNVIEEINRVTEFISSTISNVPERSDEIRSAKLILDNIVHAGPIQPDGGMMPDAVKALEELVERWDRNGELNLLVKVEPMSREQRKMLFNEEKTVFLLPTHGMHQVRVEVVDQSYETIGMIWTPPNFSDSDYHRALEFFLAEMGFLDDSLFEVQVVPIINSDDSFWVKIESEKIT